MLEAMLLKYTERALNGEAKAADFVLNRVGRAEGGAPEAAELDQDDRALLEMVKNSSDISSLARRSCFWHRAVARLADRGRWHRVLRLFCLGARHPPA